MTLKDNNKMKDKLRCKIISYIHPKVNNSIQLIMVAEEKSWIIGLIKRTVYISTEAELSLVFFQGQEPSVLERMNSSLIIQSILIT